MRGHRKVPYCDSNLISGYFIRSVDSEGSFAGGDKKVITVECFANMNKQVILPLFNGQSGLCLLLVKKKKKYFVMTSLYDNHLRILLMTLTCADNNLD